MSTRGYTSVTSVEQGGTIAFHLASDDAIGEQTLTIVRIGDPTTRTDVPADLRPRPEPAMNAWEGFGWPVSASVRIPLDWPSGYYELLHGEAKVLSFVVRAAAPGSTSRILFQISWLTPAAYNSAGGKSFYSPHDNAERARVVSLHRPGSSPRVAHDDDPDKTIREARFVEWLERRGTAIECCTSVDLHTQPDLLTNYDCLIIGYHDEYWTAEMRDHCEAFVRNGGNMIVLSGNTAFRQVRLDGTNVSFYKFAGLDDHPDLDRSATVWANPPVNRPPNSMLGVGWTHGAFRLDGEPGGSYTIRSPDHWVFDGVDDAELTNMLWYETDAAEYVEEPEGYPRVTGSEDTPLATTVLATADLRDWGGKPGHATMTIFSRNGTVFNAATTEWLDFVTHRPAVERITANVLDRLSRRQTHSWEHVGHARNGCAMASANGRLFLATSSNELWRRHPVGADVPWKQVGHANRVVAMTGAADTLHCATEDGQMWHRPTDEVEMDWQRNGSTPTGGIRALTSVGGMFYAIDRSGALVQRATTGADATWSTVTRSYDGRQFAERPSITALAAVGNVLFAATSDNELLRSDSDWVNESGGWHGLHHCNGAVGLAVVEWMLYVATADDQLWRMDISGLDAP